MSLLRIGRDTRVARAFREDIWPDIVAGRESLSDSMLERAADLAGISPADQPGRIAAARARADRALARATATGVTPITIVSDAYPESLRQIPDPPILLWTMGDPGVLGRPAVAIVGSRSPSIVGLESSRRLSAALVSAGLVVTSGLARGIDGAAHRGALQGGGATVAVLGCGADVRYPREHGDLAVEIGRRGALVTEFPPGTQPYASHFPLRNRIISGLSLATIVVEASEKSGSLITARMALEQGRSVLAVPGNALSGTHRGCHSLIKDGAALVETVEDVLVEIGWPVGRHASHPPASKSLDNSQLLREMLLGEPVSVDELATRSGRPVTEWLSELAALEIEGKVTRTAAGLFVRLDGPATNRER